MDFKALKYAIPEKSIAFIPKGIPVLKSDQYYIVKDYSITGDAPKEFIKAYFYGEKRKKNCNKWALYIAKTGHKWYPNESVTEYLFNRLGEIWDMNMAQSRLVYASGQVRFLSKYFLNDEQELVHGADIFSGYLNDQGMVEQIEQEGLARDLFSIQFAQKSIEAIFPAHAKTIFNEFIKMLIFDAIAGNNDRHFYNWGVVRNIMNSNEKPFFSPVYDTARGLFWNNSEEDVVSLHNDTARLPQTLVKYVENSKPKIGWEGIKNINHFKLVKLIVNNKIGISVGTFEEMVSEEKLSLALNLIDTEFKTLFSYQRRCLIKECLKLRIEKLNNLNKLEV